jgi:acyl-CoA synthetase (AMP-forming)/AMP-acid ligase II
MIALVEKYYLEVPEKTAFILYDPQKEYERKLTYKQLAAYTEQLGLQLLDTGYSGKTAILVYNDVLQFIIAFFACQYAGIIPIPVLFSNSKRQVEKIGQIQHDSGAGLMLSDETLRSFVEKQFGPLIREGKCRLHCIPTEWEEKDAPRFNKVQPNPVAFVQ